VYRGGLAGIQRYLNHSTTLAITSAMEWDYGDVGALPSGYNFISLGYLVIRKVNNDIGSMHFETFSSSWYHRVLLHYSIDGFNRAILEAQFDNLILEHHYHNIISKIHLLGKRTIIDQTVPLSHVIRLLDVIPCHRFSILHEARNSH
jgi:hypothetical protein